MNRLAWLISFSLTTATYCNAAEAVFNIKGLGNSLNEATKQYESFASFGSGVLVAKTSTNYYLGLTNRHVLEDVTVCYVGIDNEWIKAQGMYPVPGVDAAYVSFYTPKKLPFSQVADDDAKPGEAIYFSGYQEGNGNKLRTEKNAEIIREGYARAAFRPEKGQSGGGVYDRRGRLIGLIQGYGSDGDLHYVPIGRVRRSCARSWGYFWGVSILPPPTIYIETQSWGYVPCPDGYCRPPNYNPNHAPNYAPSYPPSYNVVPTPLVPPSRLQPVPQPDPISAQPRVPPKDTKPPQEFEAPPVPEESDAPGPPVTSEQFESLSIRVKKLEAEQSNNSDIKLLIVQLNSKITNLPSSQDVSKLKKEIDDIKNIHFDVRTLTPKGEVFSKDTVKLGDPIELRLAPKQKPK